MEGRPAVDLRERKRQAPMCVPLGKRYATCYRLSSIYFGNYIVDSLDFDLSVAFSARLFIRALRFAAFVFIFGL